jgi:filamentous hemagglutinin family protein
VLVGVWVLALAAEFSMVRAGEVTVDRSLGSGGVATPIAAVNKVFSIRPEMGRQVGSNLFHSLDKLNLDSGESADFSGPSGVSRVITRVTGGRSTINGTLRCSISGADFYLINNAGVVFGPDAKLEVNGSFIVTSADDLRFSDGFRFPCTATGQATLTTAAPAAFGFLGKPGGGAGITVNGCRLRVPDQKVLTVVGGDVRLDSATLSAGGGRVNVAATASAGEVVLDGASLAAVKADTSAHAILGGIDAQSSTIDVGGDRGGRVSIQSGTLSLRDSTVSSATGALDGLGIDMAVAGVSELRHSSIRCTTGGAGHSGDIRIVAGDLRIDGEGEVGGLLNDALEFSKGNSGTIELKVGSLTVANGGQIDASTRGEGNAGDVFVTAAKLVRLEGTPTVIADTGGNELFTGISSQAGKGSKGTGGNVEVSAADLTLDTGAGISASTFSTGRAGNVKVNVTNLLAIENRESEFARTTGVFSQAGESGGDGGQVKVWSGSLKVFNGGQISTTTTGRGNAGAVGVFVRGAIEIDGNEKTSVNGGALNEVFTGIASLANKQGSTGVELGSAGTIDVEGQSLILRRKGVISSSIFGTPGRPTRAGAVTVTIRGDLTVENNVSGIVSASEGSGDAGGGDISVSAGNLSLLDGGQINADTSGGGAGGSVTVEVMRGELLIDGGRYRQASAIRAGTSGEGKGGAIKVSAGKVAVLRRGSISARTEGPGDAGSVDVMSSGSLLLRDDAPLNRSLDELAIGRSDFFPSSDTGIFANSTSVLSGKVGSGGVITLSARNDIKVIGATVTARSLGTGGRVTANAGVLYVRNSEISGYAEKGGGAMTMNPRYLVLANSIINGINGEGGDKGPVKVTVDTRATLIESIDSSIRTGFLISPPPVPLNNLIAPVQAALAIKAPLQELCGQRTLKESSSFTIHGAGHLASEPSGWLSGESTPSR